MRNSRMVWQAHYKKVLNATLCTLFALASNIFIEKNTIVCNAAQKFAITRVHGIPFYEIMILNVMQFL